MKKKPQYSNVKFDVSDLELRKHRLKNKAPDKEIKPCMNEYISISRRELIKWAGLLYNTNYRPAQKVLHHIQHKLQNKKYVTEKPESAWEIFRELIVQVDNVQFADELFEELGLNTWEFVDAQEAIKIMQKKKKEIKE